MVSHIRPTRYDCTPLFNSSVASIYWPSAVIFVLQVAVDPTINILGLMTIYSTPSGGSYAASATLAKTVTKTIRTNSTAVVFLNCSDHKSTSFCVIFPFSIYKRFKKHKNDTSPYSSAIFFERITHLASFRCIAYLSWCLSQLRLACARS